MKKSFVHNKQQVCSRWYIKKYTDDTKLKNNTSSPHFVKNKKKLDKSKALKWRRKKHLEIRLACHEREGLFSEKEFIL